MSAAAPGPLTQCSGSSELRDGSLWVGEPHLSGLKSRRGTSFLSLQVTS